jgi:hypothetical protein
MAVTERRSSTAIAPFVLFRFVSGLADDGAAGLLNHNQNSAGMRRLGNLMGPLCHLLRLQDSDEERCVNWLETIGP